MNSKQKLVVILNAPPFCGKDTLADLMVENLKATKHAFKEELYKAMAEYYVLDLSYILEICTNRDYKDNLKSDFSASTGLTPREGLIFVSEEVYKPTYGKDYFGVKASENISEGINAFADGGGWWPELEPVAQVADKVIICRLYRNGYTFEEDSRQYYNESRVPESIKDKVTIWDIHLEENKPLVALDEIKELIK